MHAKMPSEVLYSDLRSFGGISNREAARILLSDSAEDGGTAPRLRIDEKTFLSRCVVHLSPDRADRAMYGDFMASTQRLASMIIANAEGSPDGVEGVYRHYEVDAARQMAGSLDACGRNGDMYLNAVERIGAQEGVKPNARFVLNLLAFVVCGCLADPSAAADEVRRFAFKNLSFTFSTMETRVAGRNGDAGGNPDSALGNAAAAPDAPELGLLRLSEDGTALPPIHTLSKSESGTVIGSFATGGSAIHDVGVDVSHRHLRIFFDEGTWRAVGLGSTNGSELVTRNGETVTIEEPRSLREAGASGTCAPAEIHSGDVLTLGNSTRFLVLSVSSSARRLA